MGEDVAPYGHDGVADVFVEGAALGVDAGDHFFEVFVELVDECDFVCAFGEGREGADVGEEDGDGFALAAEVDFIGVFEEFL